MNLKLFGVISLILSVAAGCTTITPIVGPDGTENHLISCPTIEWCYKKANEFCKGPYKIVNTSAETTGGPSGTATATKLLIKCGV